MNITGSVPVPLYQQCNITVVFSNEAGSSEPFILPFVATITSTTATIETETPSTNESIDDNIVPLVAGAVSTSVVLVILFILTICFGTIIAIKRKSKTTKEVVHFEQADSNEYEETHNIAITTSPVQLTSNRAIDDENDNEAIGDENDNRAIGDENPYHVTMSEFLTCEHTIPSHNVEELMQQEQNISLPSMTKLETNVEESIKSTSSTTTSVICDTEPSTDSTATGSNISITSTVSNTAIATADVYDTTAANSTYANLGKRTNTTPFPPAAQTVIYDKVTGDINKRGGGVTVYQSSEDISAIPPPPSYDDTVAQECSATVSISSQFVVPVIPPVADAAVVHGQYEKYPPKNEYDYDINTPVEDDTCSTDTEIVQPNTTSVPLNKADVYDRSGSITDIIPMNVNKVLPAHFPTENSFIDKSLSVEEKPGELVTDIMLNNSTEVVATSCQVMTSNKYNTPNVFEDDSDYENYGVPELVPSTRNKVNLLTQIFRCFFIIV
ncbi:PREDICTED: uncharacterized protein LOC109587568 [Amphimedon queenslandica]|uniref:Uncharacterized protein n=1 Tax=Amphimedon queenslandica TaxID=400682 RepID=A0AAN0JQR1_AMPQE|nr:PREDICTED: uncharacterized protein LOC109587568 [Amphimedon queenslandica]|eukprot:XP_019859358.1 PREDICTED: uncharacterized protein LOC109587568 [Amphimedon queenslandica]